MHTIMRCIITCTCSYKYAQYSNEYDVILQLAFTVLFDLEAVFKIWCLGFQGYKKRPFHKFELLLAVGNTLHVVPPLYRGHCTYFQVQHLQCTQKFCLFFYFPFMKISINLLLNLTINEMEVHGLIFFKLTVFRNTSFK